MKKCDDSVFSEIIEMSGINIDFLSTLIDVSKSTFYKFNRGLLPTNTNKAKTIADFLKIDIKYLQKNEEGSICFFEFTSKGFLCKKVKRKDLSEYLKTHSIFALIDFNDIARFSCGEIELNSYYNEISLYFFYAFLNNIWMLENQFNLSLENPIFFRKLKKDIKFLKGLEKIFTLEESSKHSRMYSIWNKVRTAKIYIENKFPYGTLSTDLCKENEITSYSKMIKIKN